MNKPLAKLPPETVTLLCEIDHQLAALEPGNPFRLYELLHHAAARLAPVDAFYICLYSEADHLLYFPYNVDGDIYEEPAILPLGNGPTSQVIRTGHMQLWNDDSAPVAGRILFGQQERRSQSAAHLPLRPARESTKRPGPVLGVLSAHSYTPHSYGPLEIAALQALADRAVVTLRRQWDASAWHYHLGLTANASAPSQDDSCPPRRPQVTMAEEFIAVLLPLTQEVEALRALLPPDAPALREAVETLCRHCYRAQTQVSELPLRPDLGAPSLDPRLADLTLTEMAILRLINTGKSNRQIANLQFCTALLHNSVLEGKPPFPRQNDSQP